MTDGAEYVLALVRQSWLAYSDQSVIPISLLQGDSAAAMKQGTAQVIKLNTELNRLRELHGIQLQDWSEADGCYRDAFVQLAQHERSQCQLQVEIAVQTHHQLEASVRLMLTRRADVKHLLAQKEHQRTHVTSWLGRWRLWGDALLRFCQKHGLQLPDQSAYTQGDQDLQDLTTEAIGRRYPWAEGSGELASASCSVLCQMQCRHVWQACTSDGHQVLLPGGLRAGHVFT